MSESDFLRIVQGATSAESPAFDRLFASLYDELHRLAQQHLRQGVPITLSPTTLLHETFLNISGRDSVAFADRGQFLTYAGRAMRGLIVDYYRSRRAQKRGGDLEIATLPTEVPLQVDGQTVEIERLNDALESLALIDARLAECVDLKFFCGFSFGEIARLRDVSERTVQRDWDKARVLLNRLINGAEGQPQAGTAEPP